MLAINVPIPNLTSRPPGAVRISATTNPEREQPTDVGVDFLLTKNKSSAVAEMGDRGHNRHGPKRGGGGVPLL